MVSQIITRAKAKEQGLSRYFTGKPCKYGHVDFKLVSSLTCCECNRIKVRKWNKDNKQKLSIKNAEWYQNNKEYWKEKVSLYSKNNRYINNAARSKYKATKLKATLPGYDSQIKEIYKDCPDGHEVDHIVPLQGENVCGLHVPWNLQYLTIEENRKKSNKF